MNADTGSTVRRLVNNDILSFPHPIALVAVAPGARVVIFQSPWRVIDKTPSSFSFPRELSSTKLRPLRISRGVKTLRAFADWRKNEALSVKFEVRSFRYNNGKRPLPPATGPKPWEAVPVVPSDVSDVAIPDINAPCKNTVPVISKLTTNPVRYFDELFEFKVGWCSGTNPLRVRFLSYDVARNRNGVKTTVLRSYIMDDFSSNRGEFLFFPKVACKPKQVFVELCGKRAGKSTPVCATSNLATLPADPVTIPYLLVRSPSTVTLPSRKQAMIRYEINPELFFGPGLKTNYRLQIAAVSRRGKLLGSSGWVSGTKISVGLPLQRGTHGPASSWEYNGAKVFLRIAPRSCPTNAASLRERYATEVAVRWAPTLLRQDKELPQIEKLVYPRTALGQPVTLMIRGMNPGMGLTNTGKSTELTYQWLIRESDRGIFPSFPRKLEGETGKSLKLAKARCEFEECFKGGCSGLRRYHVLVCNTLGCVMSNEMKPDIILKERCPPPSEY